MNSVHSTIYLPIPQCNTDSDDSQEEELHSSQENHVKRHPIIIQNTESGIARIMNYKQLDEDHDIVVSLNGFQHASTDVANNNKPLKLCPPRLSRSRKIAFVASICMCFITIVIFIWVLPCYDHATCHNVPPLVTIKSWETPFPDLEIYGPINLVGRTPGREGWDLVLVSKPSIVSMNKSNIATGGQIRSLSGQDGHSSWTQMLFREPTDIDCSLIDVNRDSVADCIIVGTHDLFKVVNPLSGDPFWEFHATNNQMKPVNLQFPLILPDLNDDFIEELLVASAMLNSTNSDHVGHINHLLLVSGRSGAMLGKPVEINGCSSISGLVFDKDLISFTCVQFQISKSKESIRTMSLTSIMTSASLTSLIINLSKNRPRPPIHQLLPANQHIARVSGSKLVLQNTGVCPERCQMEIVVKDNLNNTYYNATFSKVFGMAPVTIQFKHLSAYVLKLWQWHDGKIQNNSMRIRRDPNSVLFPKKRRKLLVDPTLNNGNSSDISLMDVSEHILLIPFNDTDFHVVNVSQQEIILLCKSNEGCQPRMESQIGSLLVADLDQDGSRELITYTSSFQRDLNPPGWRLMSKVRVVRLEAELPEFFNSLRL